MSLCIPAACCSLLNDIGVAVCCSVLQCVACRSASYEYSHCIESLSKDSHVNAGPNRCCSVLQCVAVCCSVFQIVAQHFDVSIESVSVDCYVLPLECICT